MAWKPVERVEEIRFRRLGVPPGWRILVSVITLIYKCSSGQSVCWFFFGRKKRWPLAIFLCRTMPSGHGHGAVAQLGERVVRNDEVGSSILLCSTIFPRIISPEKNGWNGYKMGVGEDEEITETLWYLALSIMPICVGTTQIAGDNVGNRKVNSLVEEYELLYAQLKPQISPSSN